MNPDLVARDKQGKPYTVRYEAVNAMLLNEFLKEHRKVKEQEATIVELKSAMGEQGKEIKALAANVKEQAAQLQTVSDQIQASGPHRGWLIIRNALTLSNEVQPLNKLKDVWKPDSAG